MTKNCLKYMLGTALLIPALSHADFTIVNKTSQPSTCYLNLGACSTTLKKYGTTYPGATNTVPHNKLLLACGYASVCTAIVFTNDSCSANARGVVPISDYSQVGNYNSVALVNIDTATDTILSVDDHFSHYRIYGLAGVGTSAVGTQGAMIVDTQIGLMTPKKDAYLGLL